MAKGIADDGRYPQLCWQTGIMQIDLCDSHGIRRVTRAISHWSTVHDLPPFVGLIPHPIMHDNEVIQWIYGSFIPKVFLTECRSNGEPPTISEYS